jgi:hypothetical protein
MPSFLRRDDAQRNDIQQTSTNTHHCTFRPEALRRDRGMIGILLRLCANISCPHPRRFDDLETVTQFLGRANAKVMAKRLMIAAEIGDVLGTDDGMYVVEQLGHG